LRLTPPSTVALLFGYRAWAEGAPSATRNLVFFASERPIRLRPPTKEDELRDGSRSAALKRYFLPMDAENAPEGKSLDGISKEWWVHENWSVFCRRRLPLLLSCLPSAPHGAP
jgi:hypothetical protein